MTTEVQSFERPFSGDLRAADEWPLVATLEPMLRTITPQRRAESQALRRDHSFDDFRLVIYHEVGIALYHRECLVAENVGDLE